MPPLDPAQDGEATPDKSGNGQPSDQDERTVPLEALEKERSRRQRAEVEAAELRGRAEGSAAAAPSPEPPKTYTRVELNALVDSGQISEADRDATLDRQNDAKMETMVAQQVDARVSATTTEKSAAAQVDEYTAKVPDLMVDGSDIRNKVRDEYIMLVKTGLPEGNPTQVAALRSVVGAIEAVANPGKTEDPEPSHENLGSGDDNPPADTGGAPKDMSAGRRAYYQDQIGKGAYKDWNAVNEELKFADKRVLARDGARA